LRVMFRSSQHEPSRCKILQQQQQHAEGRTHRPGKADAAWSCYATML
jgi:hypothetical protein